MVEISIVFSNGPDRVVSVLNREPMWLKYAGTALDLEHRDRVSVLNREPMWLKCHSSNVTSGANFRFSAQP